MKKLATLLTSANMSVDFICSSEQLLLASLKLANLFCVQLLAIFISDLAAQVKS